MIHAVLRSMILEYQMNKVIFPVGPKFLVLSVISVKAGNMPRMHCVPRSVGTVLALVFYYWGKANIILIDD